MKENKTFLSNNGVMGPNFSIVSVKTENPQNKSEEIIESQNSHSIEIAKKNQTKKTRFSNWFQGNPFKKYYHAPGIIGPGFILIITLVLIVIPATGFMTIPSLIPTSHNFQFNSNQTVSWDGSYAESEFLSAGNKITYNVSSNNPVSIMILNNSIENLNFIDKSYEGTYNQSLVISTNSSLQFFLRKGDSLDYTVDMNRIITCTNYVACSNYLFFITDQPTWSKWSKSGWEIANSMPTNAFNSETVTSHYSGSFTAPYTQEWHIALVNSLNMSGTGFFSIHYKISSLNLSQGNINILNTKNISQNYFTAPSNGVYTFFIINPPQNNSLKQSAWVSSNIIFHQNYYGNYYWKKAGPYLLVIAIFSLLLIVTTVMQRAGTRHAIQQIQDEQTINRHKTPQKEELKTCGSCGKVNAGENYYCDTCGSKLKQGTYTAQKPIQESADHYCSVCGSGLHSESKYCPQCGNEND